ncbi:heterokaryon incompatibility protein-domain-containing protein [Lophiotrema nucula]|uniref:Heterokaryon incompatibility protein-domain-containing protein n=1 Tax=Lophiotrema nucula TaxID=690887 RepID=A0A6A5Z887_9PLEO|nr:heterokaryon incompatibility protein-domain-containing protein [Lophiotrema nucula]
MTVGPRRALVRLPAHPDFEYQIVFETVRAGARVIDTPSVPRLVSILMPSNLSLFAPDVRGRKKKENEIEPYPSSIFRNSERGYPEEICDRCKELNLGVLLGSRDQAFRSGIFGTTWTDSLQDYPPDRWKNREIEKQIGRSIAQRVIFDGPFTIQRQCWICNAMQTYDFKLPLQATSCYKLCEDIKVMKDISTDPDLRAGLESLFLVKTNVLGNPYSSGCPNYRCTIQTRGNFVERPSMVFGSPSAKGSKQSSLLKVETVGAKPNYDLVRSWIHTCIEGHHDTCSIPQPTNIDQLRRIRLLDVHRRSLVEYQGESEFIALSYTWGDAEQPNISRNGSIPESKIWDTFLWVDSICIDQSSSDDKEEQIGLMHLIYGSATATIVPLDSPNARFGIHGILPGRLPRTSQLFARVGVDEDADLLLQHPIQQHEVKRSTWSSRAWTYQERFLSRRCIYFSRHQAYFSCCEGTHSEDEQDLSPWVRNNVIPVNEINQWSIPSGSSTFRHYSVIIGDYAGRQMSNQDDVLHAISGVLTSMEKKGFRDGLVSRLPMEAHVYGIPIHWLRYALLWFPQGARDCWPTKPRNTDRYPTWSWCGWRWPAGGSLSFNMEPPYLELDVCIFPPLQISKDLRDLTSNNRNSEAKTAGYFLGPESPERIIVSSSACHAALQMIRLVPPCERLHDENTTIEPASQTALRTRGILLRVACAYNSNTSSFDVSGHSKLADICFLADVNMPETRGICSCDLLLIAIRIDPESYGSPVYKLSIKAIPLKWEHDAPTYAGLKTATRIGSFRHEASEEEFLMDWAGFNPRYEEFWFR